jgi:transposase
MAVKSWELSDELWSRLEPLIPPRPGRDPNKKYQRKPGGGRKPADPRKILEGILYVLRTGCQWNAVPRCYGGGSTIHRYFQQWARAGFFENAWKTALKEYDELKEIEWAWQSIDGAMTKAPLGGEATGPNPTDRGKKRNQAAPSGGRQGRSPLDRRHRGKCA